MISGNGYVGVALGQLAVFSCYFSSNVADALVELDLAALEEHIRKRKGPLILAGDINAKARHGQEDHGTQEATYLKK